MCEICQDRKFIYVDAEGREITLKDAMKIHPVFVRRCMLCQTISKKTIDIPKRYDDCTFSTYDRSSYLIDDTQKFVYSQLSEYVTRPMTPSTGFLLCGPSGIGKTHLLISTLVEYTQQGKRCWIRSENELLQSIKYHSSYKYGIHTALQDVFQNIDIIAIRRIGDISTAWDRDILSQIYMSIYEADRWSICGTSYYTDDLSQEITFEKRVSEGSIYHYGLYSKIRYMCPTMYIMIGSDYREIQRARND